MAPEARIIWHADFDPGTLRVEVVRTDRAAPDRFDVASLAPWLSVTTDRDGREHAVLSDGWHHLRIDVEAGSLARPGCVLLEYRLAGLASAQSPLLTLRRFLQLAIHRRFAASLFPHDQRIRRWLTLLRVSDALHAGASQREIGRTLFGKVHIELDWGGGSDSLRSRVRRLVRDARAMTGGGYRYLLRKGSKLNHPSHAGDQADRPGGDGTDRR